LPLGGSDSHLFGKLKEDVPMSPARLSFASELDPPRLTELFADGSVIEEPQALEARVMVAIPDFSDERAKVLRRLNEAKIPLIGIPLFPEADGYYFTVENADRAEARYEQLEPVGRAPAAVGLDPG
jgi:hypothetical protein